MNGDPNKVPKVCWECAGLNLQLHPPWGPSGKKLEGIRQKDVEKEKKNEL